MFMPRLFTVDDVFNDVVFHPEYEARHTDLMKTDIKETEDVYEMTMDMSGVQKEDVNAELKDGYLTVRVTQKLEKDAEDDGRYIRRERFVGNTSRSFYVGKNVTQDEISAKFEDGLLKITIPKKDKKSEQENNSIEIQ